MGARAFEAYIQDKLAGKGIKSQYLGAKAKNADYPGSLRPFPHAEEREAINAAFDHLFTTLKHQNRTDDKGEHVQLYSAMFTPILLERYANSDWADQVRDDLGRWTEQSIPKVEPKLLNDHSGKNVHEQLRKWGLATIRDESFKNNDKNWSIKVDKGGIKKIAAQSIDSAMSLLVLPEVIKHSIFESTEKNTKSNANPDAVFHYFLCPVVMHGDTWAIRMTVEESKQTGKKAYTLHAIEIKKGSPQIPGGRRSVIEPGVRQAPEINIDKAWEEIKSGNDYYSQNPDNFTIEHYAGKDQLRWDFGDEHEPVGGPAISSRRRKPPKSQAEADEMAKNGHMVVTGTSRDVLKCERCGRTHLHKTYVVETIGDDGKPMRDKHYYGSDCVSRMTGKPIESIQRAAAAAQHIRQVESSRQPVKYSQESDDLFYDANRERQTRDLYNALSDAFLVDRYDNTNWSEQLHPRGHKGNENGGRFTSKGDSGGTATESHPPGSPSGNRPNQSSGSAVDAQSNGTRANGFSSKVRQIASVPDIQFHHSLHIRNQPPANQIALNDYKKSFNHLWRTASGKAGVEWTDATAEEKIWDNVDKNKLTELLNNINAKDKALRADGGSGLSDSINYNQVIPRHFAERLHGGSRFFDPEKLQRKWHEAAPPPKPESIGHLPGQTNPGQIQSSDLSKAFTSELSKKRPSKSKPNGFQPELPVQENPGQIQPPKVNPVEDELSEKTRKMVNKAISELISSDPQTIEDFRPILISAWKQKLDEAAQHNHAFREIVGTRTPQFMSALVRQARNNTLDPSSKKNFDIMVHSAESGRFGHLLQGRGEDGLLDLLSEGIKQEPNIMDEDVAELAVGMAGPGFFGDRDPGEAPEELQPAGSSEDWNDQFSWRSARALVERYSHESPTPAQREAGNYRKKHIRIQGMGISIENKKGTRRKPDWPKLHCDYGYIKRTMGADGDHVDVFVGPSPGSEIVYIIDQVDKNGRFDEHKAMVGFTSKQQAVEAYKKCYTPSWKVGRVTAMTVGQFKLWLDKGNQKESISKQVSRYQMSLGRV